MPENLLIHTPSDEHRDVTKRALSTEAMTDTTLPAKKTKSEKRKETSFNLFPRAYHTALMSHLLFENASCRYQTCCQSPAL